MKVTYVKSACVMIEHNGKRLLCDPWLTDGIYYGAWYHFPPLKVTPQDFKDVDYLYLSHIHPDHFDPETLKHFNKDIPVLICEYEDGYFKKRIESLGFTNILEIKNRGTARLPNGLDVEILAGDDVNALQFAAVHGSGIPYPYTKTRQIDSLAIFKAGDQVVVNSNDVPYGMMHSALEYLTQKYPRVDVLLVSYCGAGPFPQAYGFTDDIKEQEAARCGEEFLGYTFSHIKEFKPKYFIPFAGQYTLGGRLAPLNKYKGVVELDDLGEMGTAVKERIGSEMVVLDPGGSIDLDKGQIEKRYSGLDRTALNTYIKDVLSTKKLTYELAENRIDPGVELLPKLHKAQERLWRKQHYWRYYSHWDVILDIGKLYRLSFDGRTPVYPVREPEKEPYLVAKLDHSLMNMILDRKAHWNNAEVGSHITLYPNMSSLGGQIRGYEPMVHFLMSYFQN